MSIRALLKITVYKVNLRRGISLLWATFFYDRIFALGIAKANLRGSVLSKQSESVKDRILGAVTIMDEIIYGVFVEKRGNGIC